MSSGEPHSVIWKRPTNNCTESDDDVWDDRALIKAYDKATSKVQAVIAEKGLNVGGANSGAVNTSYGNRNKYGKGPRRDQYGKDRVRWQVGQFCKTVFSEDNIEYDAQITAIDPTNETCIVQYVGYGNEEEKSFHELKPSFGRMMRKAQVHFDTFSESESEEPQANSSREHQKPGVHTPKSGFKKRNFHHYGQNDGPSWFSHQSHHHKEGHHHSKVPFFPPPPNFRINSSATGSKDSSSSNPNEEEALASMLMSWYMSGYHTGYYRALKQSRLNCNCQQH